MDEKYDGKREREREREKKTKQKSPEPAHLPSIDSVRFFTAVTVHQFAATTLPEENVEDR